MHPTHSKLTPYKYVRTGDHSLAVEGQQGRRIPYAYLFLQESNFVIFLVNGNFCAINVWAV